MSPGATSAFDLGILIPRSGLASGRPLRVVPAPAEAPAPTPSPPSSMPKANPGARTYRVPWADLLKKVFAVDVFACPDCGGRLQVIAFIADDAVAGRILIHLGLDSRGCWEGSSLRGAHRNGSPRQGVREAAAPGHLNPRGSKGRPVDGRHVMSARERLAPVPSSLENAGHERPKVILV